MAEQTVQVPEQFVERFEELVRLDTEIYDLKREHEIKSASVWTEVEKHFDARGKVLKYNKDKNTITIIDDAEKRDAELLKRIRDGRATPYNKTPVGMEKVSMGSALPRIVMPKVGLWQRIKNSFHKD